MENLFETTRPDVTGMARHSTYRFAEIRYTQSSPPNFSFFFHSTAVVFFFLNRPWLAEPFSPRSGERKDRETWNCARGTEEEGEGERGVQWRGKYARLPRKLQSANFPRCIGRRFWRS